MGCDGTNNVKDRDQKVDINNDIKDPLKDEKAEQKEQKAEQKVEQKVEPLPKKNGGRRSSLKMHNNPRNKLDPQALLMGLKGSKRNSVSFGQSNTFQFKQMKAMFQESHDIDKPKKLNEEEHKQFVENRRKSIKNEFSMVKELMKKNKEAIEEVNDSDDEAKKNMDKNIEMGKKELNEKSSSSSSSKSNSDKEN